MRAMKDSGIPWYHEIPEEWTISRVGLHYNIILGKMLCSEQPAEDYSLEDYFCAANVHFNGIDNTEIKKMWFSPLEKEQYVVKNGDLLVVEGGAGAGGSAIVQHETGSTYIQNSIMIVRAKAECDNRYLRYLLEWLVKRGYIDIVCNKATIPHFTKDKLANVPLPISTEQTKIADFLDAECARIDAVMEQTRASIEEYKKLKQSVITQAVTKGIRPNRPMKDSGIDWIGQIPAEWDCTTVNRIATVVRGASPRPAGDPRYFNGNDVPWITVAEVTNGGGKYIFTTETYLTAEGASYSRIVEEGTLLLSNSGATLGVPKITKIRGCINDGSLAFYNLQINQDYLLYVFSGRTMELRKQMQGYGQPNLNTTIVKGLWLPLPANEEQVEIVNFLDTRIAEIESLISKKEQFLSEMESYKKSLIFEYVTGKKEVV